MRLRVPMEQVPREIYDRYLSRVEADAPRRNYAAQPTKGTRWQPITSPCGTRAIARGTSASRWTAPLAFTYMRKAANLDPTSGQGSTGALLPERVGDALVLTPQATLEESERLANEAKAEGQSRDTGCWARFICSRRETAGGTRRDIRRRV
jgi:hypothetical protein